MDILEEIFKRQKEYIERLKIVERQNGFTPLDYPVDINGRHAQEHLRLLAWRINEEIHEAIEESDPGKRREEIADILHFLVEFFLAVSFSPRFSLEYYLFRSEPPLPPYTSLAILRRSLNCCMRCFKQRPWRKDNRPTNTLILGRLLRDLFKSFFSVAKAHNMTAQDIYDGFFAKAAINDERQKAFEAK